MSRDQSVLQEQLQLWHTLNALGRWFYWVVWWEDCQKRISVSQALRLQTANKCSLWHSVWCVPYSAVRICTGPLWPTKKKSSHPEYDIVCKFAWTCIKCWKTTCPCILGRLRAIASNMTALAWNWWELCWMHTAWLEKFHIIAALDWNIVEKRHNMQINNIIPADNGNCRTSKKKTKYHVTCKMKKKQANI